MSPEPIPEGINVIDYLQVLIRRRWSFITFFVICNVIVIIATFLATPLYRSETKIIIEGDSSNILRAEESSAGNSLDLFENYLETQLAIIKSDSVAGKVFREFHFEDTKRYRSRHGLAKIFQHKFKDDITLKRTPNTRMVMIGIDNWEPKLSQTLADRMAEVYIQENLRRRAVEFIRNQRMASLNADFLRLQAKLDSLSQQLGPKHPEMIELREEIRAMTKRIELQKSTSVATSDESSESSDQAILEDILMKIQESSVVSSSRMNNIAVVDPAQLPEKVTKPKRLLNTLLGLILGLGGGVVCAFVVEALDVSVKTEEDVRRYTENLPFLGSLPFESAKSRNVSAGRSQTDQRIHFESESAWAESYRLIRTRLLWSVSKERGICDVAIISSGPGEGKTTVASNLSISLAQLNWKVLLVDTDLRRGRIHGSFNLANDKGLGNYLSDNASFKSVVQSTDIPNISLVSCGTSLIDSSQLFSSEKMGQFITEARNQFDIVLYDTPPINVISDAIILVPRVQASLLVTRCGVTNSGMLSRAVSMIKESGAHLVGVVLNAAETGPMSTYHQYYKSYQKYSSP